MDPLAEVLGESPAIVALRERVGQFLRSGSPLRRPPPILIEGETGTGKGLLARAIYRAGPRASGPFVPLNCAAVPATLLEAELFGYERGAFTDARQSKPGMFQLAHGGMLFLDEIGLLPPPLQAKLLSALEDRTIRRLGGTRAEPVNVWIIAATNEDLADAIRTGAFREDLYHRLAVLTLRLPPLRERREDVVLLADQFLSRACADYGLPARSFAADARAALGTYPWPGNVRELANVVERAALLSDSDAVTASQLALPIRPGEPPGSPASVSDPVAPKSSRDIIRDHLLTTLTQTGWNISRTAAILGVSRNTVHARIARYGLRSPGDRPDAPSHHERADGPPPSSRRALSASARWQTRRLCFLTLRLSATNEDDRSLAQALNAIAEKVQAFGGQIEGLGPVGFSAVFGLGRTEEPAVLAAHSAMAIRHAVRREHPPLNGPFSVTVGLHTSEVLVDDAQDVPVLDVDGTRRAGNALDDLMAKADPNTIVVSESAAGFLRRRFSLVPLVVGTRGYRLEGLWHALRPPFFESSRLSGRREELMLLNGRLASAGRGMGQVIDLVGEAGIGKSRLLRELASGDAQRPRSYLEGRCSSATETTPFYPLLAILRDACGTTETDPVDVVCERVAAAAAEYGLDDPDSVALLTQLLTTEAAPVSDVGRGPFKRRFFGVIRQLLINRSRTAPPLLVAVEDLHWADPTSEECLTSLVEAIADAPMLLITTYRTGYRPPWAGRLNVTQLSLPPLSLEDSLGVVQTVLEPGTVPDGVVTQILARAEGNPLFLEELSRAALERTDGRVSDHVPATIEDVISIRVTRLRPRARQILGATAVIGREIPLPLLRLVSVLPEDALEDAVGQLQRADFLSQITRLRTEPVYAFRHVLFQEVAYTRLAPTERQALHLKVLDSIERLYADSLGEQLETLANHAVAAGARERAVPYLYRASQKARSRSAPAEEVRHLQKGIELLQGLPDSPDRDRHELAFQTAMGQNLLATKGYGAAEVERAYTRAFELCQRVGDRQQLGSVLTGQWVFHLLRADYKRTWELAERLLTLAQDDDQSEFLLEAHVALGMTAIFLGEFATARSHLERSHTLYDPDNERRILYGDLGVASLAYLAWALWYLGYPDQALQRSLEGLALARSQEHSAPLSVAQALGLVASIHQVRGDAPAAMDAAEQTIAYALERGFPYWVALGRITRSWSLAAQGKREAGIAEIRESLNSYLATGATLGLTRYLTLFADMYRRRGDAGEGLRLLGEATRLVDTTSERYHEAEIQRLQGEFALLGDNADPARAELWFGRALETARRQSAKSWELRAATSLARLWRDQGKIAEAHDVLAPVHSWLTEGWETADARAAAALLKDLISDR